MAETRSQKAVVNYDIRRHKLVLPIELVIEDFQQFLTLYTPPWKTSMPYILPITTGSLPPVSHPEWGEIIDAKGSFGWKLEEEKYGGPYFIISAHFKNLNEYEVRIQHSTKFQLYIFRDHSTIDLGVKGSGSGKVWTNHTTLLNLESMDQALQNNPDIQGKVRISAELTIEITGGQVAKLHRSVTAPPYQTIFPYEDMSDCSDLAIVVEGTKINCHKFVLRCRSPVFSAMLAHDMQESSTRKIEIKDFSVETVQQMVYFMYQGRLKEGNDTFTVELLQISDKYGLTLLKQNCEEALIKSLDKSNLCHFWVIADLHEANSLKEEALRHLVANRKEEVVKAAIRETVQEIPRLVADLFAAMDI